MQAQDNAYAAPQTTDLRATRVLHTTRIPVKYLWQGMARGLVAGFLSSLSMFLLYFVRLLSGYHADELNLLLIAGVFMGVTITLGLSWGIAYACFARVMPETFVEMSDNVSSNGEARGAS